MPLLPIDLSHTFSPVVTQSEHVTVGQIIAKRIPFQEVGINLAEQLGIPAHKVSKCMVKNPGDEVVPGDIIALKKNFLGSPIEKVVSKIAGIITRLERDTGILFLTVHHKSESAAETLISPIEGTVALCNNEKIVLETDKDFLTGIKGIGQQETKEVVILEEEETVETYHLGPNTSGKIVVGQYFPRDILVKCVTIGVSGIIGTKILDDDILYLQKKNLLIPIIEITQEDKGKLKKWNGKRAFIHGIGKTIILLHM